jgi:hypothetical protein
MNANDLKGIATEGRRLIQQELETAELMKGLREAATNKGVDWSELKKLLKAQIQDEADNGDRVEKIVRKAEFASAYADMLRIREDERVSEKVVHEDELSDLSSRSKSRLDESMRDSAVMSQKMAEAGLISPEAAAETAAMAAKVSQKLGHGGFSGEIDLTPPDFLRRQAAEA